MSISENIEDVIYLEEMLIVSTQNIDGVIKIFNCVQEIVSVRYDDYVKGVLK